MRVAAPLRHADADIQEDALDETCVVAFAGLRDLDDFARESIGKRLRDTRHVQACNDFVVDRAEEGNILWAEGRFHQ